MADRYRPTWRRALFTPAAGRLRAGWRLAAVIPALLAGSFVAAIPQYVLLTLAPDAGPVAAVAFALGWLVFYGGLAVTLLAMGRYLDRRPWDAWLDGPGRWPDLAAGLAIGIGMVTAAVAAGLATRNYEVTGVLVARPDAALLEVPALAVRTGATHPLLVAAVLLVFYVGVGFFEEVLVRGYLLTNLAEGVAGVDGAGPRGATAFAAVATSVLFGVLHLGNPGVGDLATLNVALAGLFFAGAYVATGSLAIPIGLHVAWNFALGGVYGLPVSGLQSGGSLFAVARAGDPFVTGGGFGPEAGLVFYPALAVGVLATAAWLRYTRRALAVRESIATYVPARESGAGNG